MKKIILLALITLTIIACSKDDEASLNLDSIGINYFSGTEWECVNWTRDINDGSGWKSYQVHYTDMFRIDEGSILYRTTSDWYIRSYPRDSRGWDIMGVARLIKVDSSTWGIVGDNNDDGVWMSSVTENHIYFSGSYTKNGIQYKDKKEYLRIKK